MSAPSPPTDHREIPAWKQRMWRIIFEADTPAGKAFDVALLISIGLSVFVIMLESIDEVREEHGQLLWIAEWFFTLLFTAEYFCRLICVRRPGRYARSFFGVIDLVSILPTYLSLFLHGPHYFAVVRILRLLRLFRVFKMVRYIRDADFILDALRNCKRTFTIFFLGVLTLITILGTLMYLIEGDRSGFTSIPRSLYWAVVTLTTVGYGDIAPQTPFGQTIASVGMLMGYAIIAAPALIVTLEAQRQLSQKVSGTDHDSRACPGCGCQGHVARARFCHACGDALLPPATRPGRRD